MTGKQQLSLTTEWVNLSEEEKVKRGTELANLLGLAGQMAEETRGAEEGDEGGARGP